MEFPINRSFSELMTPRAVCVGLLRSMMNQFLLIFVGGGVGSFSRFLISTWVANQFGPAFPFGTLAVNLIGCLMIGLIAGLPLASASLSPATRLLLMTGFLGGLTTFSSYEYESFMLAADGAFGRALLNLSVSVVLGFLAVGLGYVVMRFLTQWMRGGY
jgi:CrcB protein